MRSVIVSCSWFLGTLLLFGEIQDHLKKAEGKSGCHTIRNVDFIYMINLDERPEKWEFCTKQLNPYKIYPYRFSAVNGWKLSLEAIKDVGLKFDSKTMVGGFIGTSYESASLEQLHSEIGKDGEVYFCHCTARGTIGIALSHLSVLRDAIDSGYETIWIMEDDIEVLSDPNKISELVDKLDKKVGKKKWDILFTDRNSRNAEGEDILVRGAAKRPNFYRKNRHQYKIYKQITKDFIRIGARFGAYSMIIRRSGMRKIYNFITQHSIFLPYDMDFYLPVGLKMYTVVENVVSNYPKAISDNGGENYL